MQDLQVGDIETYLSFPFSWEAVHIVHLLSFIFGKVKERNVDFLFKEERAKVQKRKPGTPL